MQRWNPPLPQGWEGRWDPSQQRYFFINHYNKKTQWEDPRFQAPQPQAQPQVNPYAAATSLSPSQHQHHARGASRSPSPAARQSYQMQDMGGSASRSQGHTPRHEQQQPSQQESTMSEEVDQSLVDKLHREFPNTTKALIADILAGCFNNEREAREQLNDLGFAIKGDSRETGSSPARTSASASSSAGASSRQQQSAASKELTILEKNRIHQQMSVAFPGASMDIIEMTMKVVKYDVAQGKVLLQRFLEDEEKKKASKSKTSTSDASGSSAASQREGGASSSAARAVSPARNEPAGLKANIDNQPQGLSSGVGQLPTSYVSKILIGSSGSNNTTQTRQSSAASTSSSGGRQQPTQYSNAKQVTKGRKNVPPKKKTVVTSQPRQAPRPQPAPASTVTSSQGSNAIGPDPTLRKGPDSSLLSRDLSQASGPDLTLRNGPDRSLCAGPVRDHVNGPLGAAGPDMSLRCGPQASLLGCNVDHTKLLISEI